MITKPMLYYIFLFQPFKYTIFTMYVILAPLSGFGAALGAYRGLVNWRHVAALCLCTSLIGTSIGACIAKFMPDILQLILFAILVILVASHTWYQQLTASPPAPPAGNTASEKAESKEDKGDETPYMELALKATVAGVLCGTLGVGGGFMLTPILLSAGHSMDSAVPTSLAVIALNSIVGIIWYATLFGQRVFAKDWLIICSLLLLSCLGMLSSDYVASMMSKNLRQRIFATLLLLIGFGTIVIESTKISH